MIYNDEPGRRANVYLPPEVPQYAAILEWTQTPDADPLDWRHDEHRGGIWVALSVYQNHNTYARHSMKPAEDQFAKYRKPAEEIPPP